MTRRTFLAKILISIALLGFFALKIDISELKSMTHYIHPSSWIFALAFMFLQITGLSWRWGLMVNTDTPPARQMRFSTSLRITAMSFLANYLLITTIGGIVARVVLTMSHGFSFVKSVTAAFLDRAMTLLALLIMTALFMPFLWNFLGPQLVSISGLYVLLITGCVSVLGLFVLYRNRRAIIFSNRKIAMGYKYLRALITNPQILVRIILISLASQLMYFAAVYVIMTSLGADFSFLKFMAVIPIITLIASLPVGYGGWGIREGAFMYGLGLINMPLEAAFMASVQIGLISMLAAAISGIPALYDDETQNALNNWRLRSKLRKHHVRH